MEQIYIAGQMVDLQDERLSFRLDAVDRDGCQIKAQLTVDLGGAKYTIPEGHSEALKKSEEGRQRLMSYPKQVQDWLIPNVWGEAPTVSENRGEQ